MEDIDFKKILLRLRQWVAFIGLRRLVAGACTTAVIAAVAWFIMKPSPVPIESFIPQVTSISTMSTSPVPPTKVKVHVAGAVKSPGVYQLASSARVVDAIAAAGGALVNADLESINLAQTIVDTEQVYVPQKHSARSHISVAPRLRPRRDSATTVAPGGSGAGVPSSPGPKLVNLNTATSAELDTLTGVGPSTAKAIISYRTKKGSFTKVEDLLNVPGVGPSKLAAMRDEVTVG